MKISSKERFERKVKKTDSCWVWTGRKHRQGYGLFFYKGKTRYAHRVSYELYVGPMGEGDGYHGMCILHSCDNPSCVNPEHLFSGSHKDNMTDKEIKGRGGRRGSPKKISDENILKIKTMHENNKGTSRHNKGYSLSIIAKEYGVHPVTVAKRLRKLKLLRSI